MLPNCTLFLLLESAESSIITKSALTGLDFSDIALISAATLSWFRSPDRSMKCPGSRFMPD